MEKNLYILPSESKKSECVGRAIAAYEEFCKWRNQSPLFSFDDEIVQIEEFNKIFLIDELSFALNELYDCPLNPKHLRFNWVKAINTFTTRMEWYFLNISKELEDSKSSHYIQLHNNGSVSNKSKPVNMFLGRAEAVKLVIAENLPAIRNGARYLFVTEASFDVLLTYMKTFELDFTKTNVYVAKPAAIPTGSLSEKIFASYLRRYGETPTSKFWNVLSAIDISEASKGVMPRFSRPLNFFRLDPDGASRICIEQTRQRTPIARDFATILAARKIVSRTAKVNDDYGRVASARWVKAYSAPIPFGVEIDNSVPMEHRYRPKNWNGVQLLYIHGGGLVHYNLEVFTPLLSRIAQDTRAEVIAVSYDKMPEKSASYVIDDLMARIKVIIKTTNVRSVVGDSIGGLLALYTCLRAFPQHFKYAVLLYPVLSIYRTFPAYDIYGEGYLLDSSTMRWFRSLSSRYFRVRGFDPLMLSAHSLGKLKVSIFSAGCDVLADEAYAFAQAHPAVHHHCFTDLPHDFCLYGGKIKSARLALSSIINQLCLIERKE